MISISTSINHVDRKTLEEKLDEKKNLLYIKPKKVEFEPKYKKKGKSKTGRHEARKQGVKHERKIEEIKQKKKLQKQMLGGKKTKEEKTYNVFARFTKSNQ